MKCNKWMILGLGMALMLAMAACSGQETEETASPSPDPVESSAQEEVVESPAAAEIEEAEVSETLTLAASFQDETGAALAGATVGFAAGETEAEYLTGEDGALTVAGLPRTGAVEVTLLDEEGEALATATLELSEGSVTDVTEGEDGSYLVTLLTGGEELSLCFVQQTDGSLTCTLDLSGEGDA